jgi:hypothetical protein
MNPGWRGWGIAFLMTFASGAGHARVAKAASESIAQTKAEAYLVFFTFAGDNGAVGGIAHQALEADNAVDAPVPPSAIAKSVMPVIVPPVIVALLIIALV